MTHELCSTKDHFHFRRSSSVLRQNEPYPLPSAVFFFNGFCYSAGFWITLWPHFHDKLHAMLQIQGNRCLHVLLCFPSWSHLLPCLLRLDSLLANAISYIIYNKTKSHSLASSPFQIFICQIRCYCFWGFGSRPDWSFLDLLHLIIRTKVVGHI